MTGNTTAILADIKSFTRPFTQPPPSTKGSFSFRKYYDNDPSFNASFPIEVFGPMYDTLPHDAGEEEDSNPSSDHDDNETSTQSSTPSSTHYDDDAFSFPPHLTDDPPSSAPSNDPAAPVNGRGNRRPFRLDVNPSIPPQLPSDNESSQGTTSPEPPSPIVVEPTFYPGATAQTQPHPHMYGFNGAIPTGSNANPAIISEAGMATSPMAPYPPFQHQYDAGGMAPFYHFPYVSCPMPDDANSYPNSESPSSHNFDVMQFIWNPHYQPL
jgi:hypothetical protein